MKRVLPRRESCLTVTIALVLLINGYSQVGINTENPQATLDVRGVNHNGAVTAEDGVLVPRVNDLSADGSQDGQLVYLIADVDASKKGFYYWNGNNWSSISRNSSPAVTGSLVEPDTYMTGPPGNNHSFVVNANIPIQNNRAFDVPITVSGVVGSTTLVTISVRINHTWVGDLDIFLRDPHGTWLELTTDNGSWGENFTNTVFADDGLTNITSITSSDAPFTGRYRPEGSLFPSGTPVNITGTITNMAGFNGVEGNGVWVLRIGDDAGGDTGTFLSATLNISGTLPLEWVCLGEVEITYFDDSSIVVQSTYSGDSLDLGGIKTALTRNVSSVAPGTSSESLIGDILSYASDSPSHTGNSWVNTYNLSRDVGLINNTIYYYQLWRQGNIESPTAMNETFTLVPMRIQQ